MSAIVLASPNKRPQKTTRNALHFFFLSFLFGGDEEIDRFDILAFYFILFFLKEPSSSSEIYIDEEVINSIKRFTSIRPLSTSYIYIYIYLHVCDSYLTVFLLFSFQIFFIECCPLLLFFFYSFTFA